MSDQADHLRSLVRAADSMATPGQPPIVVAASAARGGLAVAALIESLAEQLFLLGLRVVAVDADDQRQSLTRRLTDRASDGLAEVLVRGRLASEAVTTVRDGLELIGASHPLPAGSLDAASAQRLVAELRRLGRRADVALVDCGAGMSPWVGELWRSADEILLAAGAATDGVVQAYTAVKQSPFHCLDQRVRLVTFDVADAESQASADERFAVTCEKFLCLRPLPSVTLPPAGVGEVPPRPLDLLARELARLRDVRNRRANPLRLAG